MATITRYDDYYCTNGIVVFTGTAHECHEYMRIHNNDIYVYSIK